jgi:hypothetical protein
MNVNSDQPAANACRGAMNRRSVGGPPPALPSGLAAGWRARPLGTGPLTHPDGVPLILGWNGHTWSKERIEASFSGAVTALLARPGR